MEKTIKKWGILTVLALWVILAVCSWIKPPAEISEAERRKLAGFPTFSTASLLNGSFANGFESYATDQFPLREVFRGLKSRFHRNILGQLDNNDIYLADGYAAKIEYPLSHSSLAHAKDRIRNIIGKYLADTDCKVLLSIVPDKGYYLAKQNSYPAMDYDRLVSEMQGIAGVREYADLFDTLKLECYYRSDTHWRQEAIIPAADVLCGALGIPYASAQDYSRTNMNVAFYGVYKGQAALSMPAEALITLSSDILEGCRVFNYETDRYASVYDETKKESRDPYDIYLSGAAALLRIENPAQDNGRQLVVFRDSFGSSIIPLLVHGYETVMVVDIRYMSPDILEQFIEFTDQDVLFLYSTTVLNNSAALK